MKEFNEVWEDILYQVNKHKVIKAPETQKYQVIKDVEGEKISFTDDATEQSKFEHVSKDDFARVWSILTEKGIVKEADIRPLVGHTKMEFIWSVMNRLDYCEYELRALKIV